MPPANGGTFQPLLHRNGTLRERLHSYTKRTLGAGGSMNEAVREKITTRTTAARLKGDEVVVEPLWQRTVDFLKNILSPLLRSVLTNCRKCALLSTDWIVLNCVAGESFSSWIVC